jgi:peptidoglycan/LPS O-acetylase OafA/YrhL
MHAHYIFYNFDFPKPSVIMALIASIIKHHSALLFAILFVGLIFGYGFFLKPILNHPAFRVLGRISFAVYMVHLVFVKYLIAGNHYPINVNYINLVKIMNEIPH